MTLGELFQSLAELLHSIEESPQVEERLFECESKYRAAWIKLFTDRGITDIAIPPLPKEELRKSIVADLFKERCRSMGIFDLVEATVKSVISHIEYFLTLPEAQDFLKSIRKEEQRRIDEANRISIPCRRLMLSVGIEDLDSWQTAELWRPLSEVAFRRVEPPFKPLATDSEWAASFFDTLLKEVAEKFIREREKQLRESDEGRAFTFSRSRVGPQAAIEQHIDQENTLARSAKDPVDLLIYSLLKRGGYRSKEVEEELNKLGKPLRNDAIRQRSSRLAKRMENEPETDGEQ